MTNEMRTQNANLDPDRWEGEEGEGTWTEVGPGGEPRTDAPEEELDDLALIPIDHALNLYLKEVSRVPLLSKEEEVELAACYRAGRDAERRLQEQGQALDAQERERLQAAVENGQVARQRLIRANTRLVISVAKKVRRPRGLVYGPDPGRQPGADQGGGKV